MGISGRMTLARDVKILDISAGGVALKASRRLNIGCEYALKIEYDDKVLRVKGFVVWALIGDSIKDVSGNSVPVYTAGLRFIDVSEEKMREIRGFLKEHEEGICEQGVETYGGVRQHIRVHVKSPEQAILNFQENYQVKKLGLGGMLIESELKPDIEFRLPMEVTFTEDKTIKFVGRVASYHLVKDKDVERYDVGIEFLDMSEQDKTVLNEFVRLLENIDLGSSAP
jgi:c-di-GMP-binding flagellar brake protein YcgR